MNDPSRNLSNCFWTSLSLLMWEWDCGEPLAKFYIFCFLCSPESPEFLEAKKQCVITPISFSKPFVVLETSCTFSRLKRLVYFIFISKKSHSNTLGCLRLSFSVFLLACQWSSRDVGTRTCTAQGLWHGWEQSVLAFSSLCMCFASFFLYLSFFPRFVTCVGGREVLPF